MPIKYSLKAKAGRMEVVRKSLEGGAIILLGGGIQIAKVQLDPEAGSVVNDLLYLTGFPKFAMAEAVGLIDYALLLDKDGNMVGTGLTVGPRDADIIMQRTRVDTLNIIKIDTAEIRHA